MHAIRESTFGDMKCLAMLLKVRGAALRIHDTSGLSQDMRIVDAFSASGYVFGGSEHEILMCGGANLRAKAGSLSNIEAVKESRGKVLQASQ